MENIFLSPFACVPKSKHKVAGAYIFMRIWLDRAQMTNLESCARVRRAFIFIHISDKFLLMKLKVFCGCTPSSVGSFTFVFFFRTFCVFSSSLRAFCFRCWFCFFFHLHMHNAYIKYEEKLPPIFFLLVNNNFFLYGEILILCKFVNLWRSRSCCWSSFCTDVVVKCDKFRNYWLYFFRIRTNKSKYFFFITAEFPSNYAIVYNLANYIL